MIQYCINVVMSITNEIKQNYIIIKEITIDFCQDMQQLNHQLKENSYYKKKIKQSKDTSTWKFYAWQYDNLQFQKEWREQKESTYYDYKYIDELTQKLNFHQDQNNIQQLMLLVRSHSTRHQSGITDPNLYNHCYTKTKNLIHSYISSFLSALKFIFEHDQLNEDQKIEFFNDCLTFMGRSAILLSGGGHMGQFHAGLLKALYEIDMLPRVVSGSSSGSVIGAFYCTKNYSELKKVIFLVQYFNYELLANYEPLKNDKKISFKGIVDLLKGDTIKDIKVVGEFLKENTENMTFKEAYDKTGFILNIIVTGSNPHDRYRTLNYFTAPNVLIWSASCASAGLPFIYGSMPIYCKNQKNEIVEWLEGKTFMDGSIDQDIPKEQLSKYFNVSCFIVSQVNPFVLAFKQKEKKEVGVIQKDIYDFVTYILKKEIKTKIKYLFLLFRIPRKYKRFFNLLTQNFRGDVTVSPNPKFSEFFDSLDMPCLEVTKDFGNRMEIETMPGNYFKQNWPGSKF